MKKLLLGLALALPIAFATLPASALVGNSSGVAISNAVSANIIEVKGGHGRGGRGHGWGKSRGFKAYGWSRGRKVGWRGRGCPPGLWKQGRC